MAVWKYKTKTPLSTGGEKLHPVTEALLSLRDLHDPEERKRFLAPDFERDIGDPFLFSQMEKVVTRIGEEREKNGVIGIFGDYDADGVTSSVIMREALTACGIEGAVYIPEKNSEGHGLNPKAIDFFQEKGAKLVITLDCGMMNHEEVRYANERGIDVIIVDHHHVPEVLPEAFAIINPKLPNETYPFRELCGAGTSFKVAQALYRKFLPDKVEQLKWILDVVATGTVADVMPLLGENRAIVKYGLLVLSKTRRVGFQEMFAVGRIPISDGKVPDAHMIGFQIAPRINAASRMAHAMLAHDLLMERDPVKARLLALDLEAHNVARRKLSTETTELVRELAREKFSDKKFIFAVGPAYPFGIVGLIAGRIANEFRKPACVLFQGEKESQGSFRSIPEFNIIEALEKCADMLVKYGGHEQAAGMTIKNERLEEFYEKFNALVEEALSGVETEPELLIDMVVSPEHVTSALYRDISLMAPFGEANQEPVFALSGMRVAECRLVGNGSKHLKLRLTDPEYRRVFEAIGFSLGDACADLKADDLIDVAFQLSENTWNGSTTLQLKLLDLKRSGT